MRAILILILGAVALFALWVRFAPARAERWHTDPWNAVTGRLGGVALRPGGDIESPVYDMTPQALLTQLDAVAMTTPRTIRLAGSVEEGRITYETRSKLWQFPDYTTVEAIPAEGGAALIMDARLRFGKGDMGVNRARVEHWLRQLEGRS